MIDYTEIIEQLKDEDVFRLMERLGAQPIDKQDYILCKTEGRWIKNKTEFVKWKRADLVREACCS